MRDHTWSDCESNHLIGINKVLSYFILQDGEHVSDVGGVLGLWLGCSCVSLIELLEFLASLCRKCKRPG